MIREAPNQPTDLTDAALALERARHTLAGFESTALAAVAESLTRTTEGLLEVSERLERSRPEEWMTPERAARYLGFPSVGAFERVVAKERIPKHYLSDRLPRYSRSEIDEWLRGR